MTHHAGRIALVALTLMTWGLPLACSDGGTSSGAKLSGPADTVVADGEDPGPVDGGPADSGAQDAGPADGGPLDVAAADIVPDGVVLPKPATVPDDLPPGVVATHLSSAPYDSVGKSENLQIDLPKDTISLFAVMRGDHPGRFLLSKAVTMMGTVWMKGECVELCTTCPNRVQAGPATGAALIPSSTASLDAIKAMTWHLGSCGYSYVEKGGVYSKAPYKGKSVQSVMFSRTAPGGQVPASGTIALRLFYTGGAGITAKTAVADPRVPAMLAGATQILQTAGIKLVVDDVRDTGPGFQAVDEVNDLSLSGSSGLDTLFAEAGKYGGSAVLDVFIVGKIGKADAPGGEVQGISGGIPGPAFYHGIPRAGVAVALGGFGEQEGALAGRALARQIGHFLGLWWTSDPNGGGHDPIDDTPECGKANDGDGNGVVTALECVGKGSDNAMFWQGTTPAATFSEQQGRILRAHPLVFGP